jgi:hypothetical protein
MSDFKITPVVFRGKVNYCKFLGEPRLDYDKTGYEWTSDFYDFDEKEVAKVFKKFDIKKTFKRKEDYLDGKPYITMKQKAERANGKPNDPVAIVDANGKPWPEDVEIGNGSVADLRCEIWDFGPRRFKGFYPKAMRVLEHVEYNRELFEPLSEDDQYYPGDEPWDTGGTWDDKEEASSVDELDDDI